MNALSAQIAGPGEALSRVPVPPAVLARPILIADDDELALRLIEASLGAMQLQNTRVTARDGLAAQALLQRSILGELVIPALVMLDGQMPGMDGLDVLTWMRGQAALSDVPVIMLTGTSDVDSIRQAYDNGAASYLVKPVAFGALADVLKGLGRPWQLL